MILLDRNKNVYPVRFELSKTTLHLPLREESFPDSPMTTCSIARIGSAESSTGSAILGPKDKYDARIAYKKSFQRALNSLTKDHDLRADLWASFLKGGVSRKEAGISKQAGAA